MKVAAVTLFAVLACAAAAQTPYDCENLPRSVNIPVQPMSKALAQITKQYSCPISVDADVRALTSHAVKGSLTPLAAIVMMVQGSGLEAMPVKQGLAVGRYEQDRLDSKVATLTAKVHDAVAARRISAARGALLCNRLQWVTRSAHHFARQQGFVSAAEKASYQRTLDAVAQAIS